MVIGTSVMRPTPSKVVEHVVLQVLVEGRRGGLADMPDDKAVAVGRRLGDAGDADGAARATDVLDDDLLAERAAHGLADEPGHGVGGPAGAGRHDDGDGLVGKALRCRATGGGRKSQGQREGMANGSHVLHSLKFPFH
jgi:hypothetical protein